MSIIKIADISHVRFTAPDLTEMAGFLEEFGLRTDIGSDGVLYGRGAGTAPFQPAPTEGPAGFAGRGKVVRLHDPDGRLVEVVAGQTPVEPLPLEPDAVRNTASAYARKRASVRLRSGPSTVVRLGHAVLNVSDFRASERWYKDRFGFITSDEIAVSPEFSFGAFMRCDRGDTPTDHHTLFLAQGPRGPGFNHAAFEVRDLDDLMAGHNHLAGAGHHQEWGVGRHILGSQVFDYWRDPFGHAVEHWTDGDLFTAADGSNVTGVQELMGVQWGQAMPPTFG